MEIDLNTIIGAALGAFVALKVDVATLKAALKLLKERVTKLETNYAELAKKTR